MSIAPVHRTPVSACQLRWGPRAWGSTQAVSTLWTAAHPLIFPPPGSGQNPGLCRSLLLSFTSLLGLNLSLVSAQEGTGQREAAGMGTSTSWSVARSGQKGELDGLGEGDEGGCASYSGPWHMLFLLPGTLCSPPPLGTAPLCSSGLGLAHSFQEALLWLHSLGNISTVCCGIFWFVPSHISSKLWALALICWYMPSFWASLVAQMVKESACNVGRRRKWHPTPVLLPGKSHGWRSLVGYSPWGR